MSADFALDAGKPTPPIRQLCRYLSERSPQPMVAVEGSTHVVIYLNPAFARLVGRDRKGLIGRPFAEAVPEGEGNGCLSLLDRVFRTGDHEILVEQEHLQTQSSPVYWSYSVWAILGDDERPAGVMIQVTDATETALFRRQSTAMNEELIVSATHQHELAEEANSLSSRLQAAVEARDHFIAVLSHELRNPLSAITSAVRLARRPGLEGQAPHAHEVIERQAGNLARLIDDLLDVSRITQGKVELKREVVDVPAVVSRATETARTLIEQKRHELTVQFTGGSMHVDADPTRLEQVIGNLLTNAAKYTEEGGRITVSARKQGDQVVIAIRDTGVGIPPEMLPRVFDLFTQVDRTLARSEGGLGIGLTLVKQLVEMHGGTIEAASEPGAGSEFTVRLPLVERPPEGPRPKGDRDASGRGMRLLIVDDNVDTSCLTGRLLQSMGFVVQVAHDGRAAIEAARHHCPEVVLLDIGLPGMDGFEVARRLRQEGNCRGSLIIGISGYGDVKSRDAGRDAGFDHHLLKPVDVDSLVTLIGLSSGRAGDEMESC